MIVVVRFALITTLAFKMIDELTSKRNIKVKWAQKELERKVKRKRLGSKEIL